MPASGSFNNSSALLTAIVPHRSYAQMSARKDQEMRYARIAQEEARQDQQEQSARIQQQQDVIAQMRNLPVEEPDRARINKWVDGQLKGLAGHIAKNYPQNPEAFFQAEGEMWLKNTLTSLTSSDLYAAAQRNKEYVAMARSAMAKGEDLTGTFDEKGKYVPAESQLLDYMRGKNPTFEFKGSYKADTKAIYDYFGKMDNPNGSKFDRNARVSEEDKLNMSISTMGGANGRDMYYRYLRNRDMRFKQYSFEDQQLFNTDIANKKSMIATRAGSLDIQRQNIALKKQKLAQEKDQASYTGAVDKILGTPVGRTEFQAYSGDKNKRIQTLGGATIADIMVPRPDGTAGFEFQEFSGLTLGKDFSRAAGISKGSQLKEGIVTGAGGESAYLDLSKIPHKVITSQSNIFVDTPEILKADGEKRLPSRGYKKVTIQVEADQAEESGLYDTDFINELEGAGKAGRIVEDSKGNKQIELEVMVPLQGFFQNAEVQNRANKAFFGQKRTNDIDDSFSTPSDSSIDDIE